MRIETKSIRDGAHIGEIVWICHYHRPDLNKKPLRNVPPTKVMVMDNDILPKNKTVYYSGTHFAPLNKVGEPTKKVISPVDNTGFRSLCGNELYVFTTEEECNKEWNRQLESHCERLNVIIANAAITWTADRDSLIGMMK